MGRGIRVQCRWANGDSTLLKSTCETIGDVKEQLCCEQDCVWDDIKLFTKTYDLITNDEAKTPELVAAVVSKQDSYPKDAWERILLAHARRGDGLGVKRVIHRIGLNKHSIDDILDHLWQRSFDDWTLVSWLLDGGMSADHGLDRHGFSWLQVATTKGATDIVDLLISYGADVNAQEECQGLTPLHIAAQRGHIDIIRRLINARATIKKDAFEKIPLHSAAENKDTTGMAILLESYSHFIDSVDEVGNTPLIIAANNGNVEVCQQLISAGANINKQACFDSNFSALHWAYFNEHSELIDLLESHGADQHSRDNSGCTAKECASYMGE